MNNKTDLIIKDWYIKEFPDDELGVEIKDKITFEDLHKALQNGDDVYEFLGDVDSIVREHCFDKLAQLLGKDYDYIYRLWLDNGDSDSMNEHIVKKSLKESTELDRQAFVSLVKLGDKPYDGYSILNDGNFVKRLYADSDEDAISQFRDWIGRGGTRLKESAKLTEDTSYTRQQLIDAVKNAYGFTNKEALAWIKKASDEAKKEVVNGFRQNARKNFYDESLKESETLTERRWKYTLRNGVKLRGAIRSGDYEDIRQALIDCYDELYDKGLIDDYDHDDWTEEVRDYDFESDDDVDFELGQLYDLCDNIDVFVALDFEEALKEATTPEQRARRRGKLTTPYNTTYTLSLKNQYNYTVIQYRVDTKNKTIEKGMFNWGDGKGSFFNNRKELQRHIDDLLAQGYKMIESKDESLKEDWYHFEYESGANPYIAKSERERDRIIRKYQDRVEDLGNGNYIIHDKEEDLFSVDESIVGKTVSNDGKDLGRKLRREFGKGELTGGDNFRFNYQPRRGARKSIQTEPVDDDQTKIRVASVVDDDMNESLEGKDRKKFITLLTNELQKEPLAYSRDEANDIAIKRADALGKNPYDSIEALVKSEVSKTRSKKNESFDDDYVFDILVDNDYIDVSDYNNGIDFIDDLKTAREIRDKVKADYPDSKVEIQRHTWDSYNHYKDDLVEDIDKYEKRLDEIENKLAQDIIEKFGYAEWQDNYDSLDDVYDEVEDYVHKTVMLGMNDDGIVSPEDYEFLDDEYKVAGIRNKRAYGGGTFEFSKDVASDTADKVVKILKNKSGIKEDTVKRGNSWVNKGKEGTHGKFKTKKAADAQRRAIWVNWDK